MLLGQKNAVIYGGGGAIGGAVARAFAREGANVFLAGRTLAKVSAVAKEIVAARGVAEAEQVDALDEQAVERHLDTVARKAGGIDILFNARSSPCASRTSCTPSSSQRGRSFIPPARRRGTWWRGAPV